MMVARTLFFIYALALITILKAFDEELISEEETPCETPDKKSATCLLITDCPMIKELVSFNDNKTVRDFIKQSLCKFDGDLPVVCCGTSLSLTNNLDDDRLDAYFKKDKLESDIKQTNSISKQLPDRSICGLESFATDKIVGGRETRLDEFPWLVALEYRDPKTKAIIGTLCGGSIINNRYVLTAAHCLTQKSLELFQVRLGEWDTSRDKDCADTKETNCAAPIEVVEVEKTIAHRFYSPATKNNDIALIRLKENIQYSDYIRPICLASISSPSITKGLKLSISGWGVTENGTASNVKLKAEVPVVGIEECKGIINSEKSSIKVTLNQVCAGGEKGVDSCQGDSGGPLMRPYDVQYNGQVQWYQEGIVSWGVGCAGKDGPAVYTRVRRYRYWIENQLE